MTLVVADRVRQSTPTTGTGTITLSGSLPGFQTFSVIGDGNTTYYTIVDSTDGSWEVGIGAYTASGTTLSRDTVLSSSNSGSLVDFGVGAKDVFVTYPAEKAVYEAADGSVAFAGGISGASLGVTGAIAGDSLGVTGALTGASLGVTDSVTAGGLVTGDNFNNTDVFYYNARIISVDKTIAGTENAMSVGPIEIADTITVTVDTGGEWVIV